MDVEKAAHSIQREALHELYEFIFSEWKLVPAKDMEIIKERLKRCEDEEAKAVRERERERERGREREREMVL